MTVVLEAWPAHNTPPLPTEKQIERDAEEHKYAPLVSGVFRHIIDLAIGPKGLPVEHGRSIAQHHLNEVVGERGRHVLGGNIQEVSFEDALWLRATTPGDGANLVHTITLFRDGRPVDYKVTGMNVDPRGSADTHMVGIDEIASHPDALNTLVDLGSIRAMVETEKRDGWKRKLSTNTLNIAYRRWYEEQAALAE